MHAPEVPEAGSAEDGVASPDGTDGAGRQPSKTAPRFEAIHWLLVVVILIGLGLLAAELLPRPTGRSGHPAQQLATESIKEKKAQGSLKSPTTREPRRMLSAILFTDMIGYSAMMSTDEAQAIKSLNVHNRIIEEVVAAHDGEVVKNMGDGYLATFQSAVKAVKAALAAQQALETHNKSAEQPLLVRMGVSIGDVVVANGELIGETVNVAADIERRSKGGDVIVTESVYQQVRRKVRASAQDLGRQALKSKGEPVGLYSLKPAGSVLTKAPAAALSPSQKEVVEHEENAAKRADVLKSACDSGDLPTCIELAFLHANGTGVDRDAKKAFSLYERACKGGDGRGCYFAALKYSTGVGVKRDAAAAKRLFDKACSAGHQDACGRDQ
jgi:class 3 adenylate cyclase